ncbi:hypothetical protein [Vreelandella neptunia]|jgi:hypothetical protein|uniref:Uncharacterized protein n=1 Tax=Vreelandella neptunia TaxID=115551 RepID=A0ABS9S9S3_9GAMM|nr:hypothetical protein [Halomonas neptunia]MCH4812865.1 hypothetical protein [Halomonas neptunia]
MVASQVYSITKHTVNILLVWIAFLFTLHIAMMFEDTAVLLWLARLALFVSAVVTVKGYLFSLFESTYLLSNKG